MLDQELRYDHLMATWLGYAPSWISAIATSCALVFTSWTARNSQRSAKASEKQAQLANEQHNIQRQHEEREQASKFAAWIDVGGSNDEDIYLCYSNMGTLPVYGVHARITMHAGYNHEEMEIWNAPPSPSPKRKLLSNLTSIILGISHQFSVAILTEVHLAKIEDIYRDEFHRACRDIVTQEVVLHGIFVDFYDSAGKGWRRDDCGILKAGGTGPNCVSNSGGWDFVLDKALTETMCSDDTLKRLFPSGCTLT